MFKSFRDERTEAFAHGLPVREFQGFRRQAEKRLEILDTAETLGELAALPSNRLEALRGDRNGQYSIRMNPQWRIWFERPADGPENVAIADYH